MAESDEPRWDEPARWRGPAVNGQLGRMEAKLEAVEKSIQEVKQDNRERSDRMERDMLGRITRLENCKADADKVAWIERIVYGTGAFIGMAFLGALVSLVIARPSVSFHDGPPAAVVERAR